MSYTLQINNKIYLDSGIILTHKYNVRQKLQLWSERRVYVGLHPRMADIQQAEYIVSHLSKYPAETYLAI